jgi:hypothetical protein
MAMTPWGCVSPQRPEGVADRHVRLLVLVRAGGVAAHGHFLFTGQDQVDAHGVEAALVLVMARPFDRHTARCDPAIALLEARDLTLDPAAHEV